MKPFILLTIFLFFATKVDAQTQYLLIGDQKLSSIAGAEDLITIHKGLYTIENNYLKPTLFEEHKWHKKILGISYRLTKTALLDYPLDYIFYLLQHEIYGHGAKYREYGFIDNRYTINIGWPYGSGGGRASIGNQKNWTYREFSIHEFEAIYFGGIEANTVLSKTLMTKWLLNGTINYRETLLYLRTFHNISTYILNTKDEYSTNPNDILYYLLYLNRDNGMIGVDNYLFTLKDLRKQLIINAFDPFQYFAVYTYLKSYVWSGKEEQKLPMIPIGKLKYLPSFHLGLTPFGSEFYFENYLSLDDKLFTGYYRQGDNTFHRFWGAGIKSFNLLNNKYFYFNTSIDFWEQPGLKIGGDSVVQTNGGFGGAINGTFIFKTLKKPRPVNIYIQIGYKTFGYLEGEKLSEGLIIRLGLSFEETL